jgi:MFS family permease
VAGVEIRRYSEDRRGQASNFLIGVAGAALTVVSDTLLLPALVLAAFVSVLTDSYVVVGAVPAIGAVCWFVAQLLAAPVIGSYGRKLPWAAGASLVRAAALILLAYVVNRADRVSTDELLRSVLICFAAYSFASGFAATTGTSVYTRAVPAQHQTLFFRLAQIAAAAAAVIAGILGARVLGPDGPDYPDNFSRLFLAAAVAAGGVVLLQLLTREPGRLPASARGEGIGSAAAVRGMGLPALADATFRRFLVFRVALGLAAIADPFFILYAQRELGIAATRLGWFLLALVAARVISAPFWAWMTRVHGTRATLQAAGMLRILPPLVAISLPYLIDTDLWRDRITEPNAVPIAFGVVFVAMGFALGGLHTATFGYLVESLPATGRAGAIGLTNLILAGVSIAPVLGGLILRESGADYERLFLIGGGLALLATLSSGLLVPARARPRQAEASWRLRRST